MCWVWGLLWHISNEILLLSVDSQVINHHLIFNQKRPKLIIFRKKYLTPVTNQEIVFWFIIWEILIFVASSCHHFSWASSFWKRYNLVTFRLFLLQIVMAEGSRAMGVGCAWSSRNQKGYQIFSHFQGYVDIISKFKNHDRCKTRLL